jgi:hypothetical protein
MSRVNIECTYLDGKKETFALYPEPYDKPIGPVMTFKTIDTNLVYKLPETTQPITSMTWCVQNNDDNDENKEDKGKGDQGGVKDKPAEYFNLVQPYIFDRNVSTTKTGSFAHSYMG